MSIFEILLSPAAAIGCAVGIGASVALHFAFPSQDLAVVQALLVASGCAVGLFIEHRAKPRREKER